MEMTIILTTIIGIGRCQWSDDGVEDYVHNVDGFVMR
jgi:hypothetical protein